jgi:hypothetical protein
MKRRFMRLAETLASMADIRNIYRVFGQKA